jgi:hypothetical protein
MKFARSLTRNMPKYLIVFFGLLLVFNVFAFFLTPGIKEGHEGKEKKKLDDKFREMGDVVRQNYQLVQQMIVKKGKDVKTDDLVLGLKTE